VTGLAAILRVGLLEMRGGFRRFLLLIACLAVGTALIAGVGSVGASIRQAVERDAAALLGGDLELSRADRPANAAELRIFSRFGAVASVIDNKARATAGSNSAFADLVAVGPTYPLLGRLDSKELPAGQKPFAFLSARADVYGALVDPLMLDELHASVGGTIEIGGTPFEVRGTLSRLPDSPVRGFRLGRIAVITTDGLATLADRTSPLPGLGTLFRYKILLANEDLESARTALAAALGDSGWTIRSAREALGPMVHYYDLFIRFLVIVGLASLLIGGVSVWTAISAFVAERAKVIAVMRSMGADRTRIFIHFFVQVATLAVIGVGVGVLIGGSLSVAALPAIGNALGIDLAAAIQPEPLAVAAGVGLLTAFSFAYLPLQQAQRISPASLFRAKGFAELSLDWRGLLASTGVVPLAIAAACLIWLAVLMTGDPLLVAAFLAVSALSVALFRAALMLLRRGLERTPEPASALLRNALRGIWGAGSNASAIVVSVGLALAMLVVVLALETNLRHEYLGASVFDAPTFVASDMFEDEVATLRAMQRPGGDIVAFNAAPMLRGAVTAINGTPVAQLHPRGSEAAFLLSGDIPLSFAAEMPAKSRLAEGAWWPAGYHGTPLISLHKNLRVGLGLKLGDELTFSIFGDTITAKVANFRDYSWQSGIDFLVTFSPGVLEDYPATLLGAVTAAPGRSEAVARALASALPDVRFVAIGETLEMVTSALNQLSAAASLVGGIAVGNGLLVLLGSLAAGRRQREADAVITQVLGASRGQVLGAAILQHVILAAFAALLATPIGLGLAYALTAVLLDVEFAVDARMLAAVIVGSIAITGALGAITIVRALSVPPARLLREMAAE
jgi:putative ABC transport system permease protein